MIWEACKLALAGYWESLGGALNNKFVNKNKRLFSFITAYFNVLVWYFVLRALFSSDKGWLIIQVYAVGYALGDVGAINFDMFLDKLAKGKGLKFHRKQRRNKLGQFKK